MLPGIQTHKTKPSPGNRKRSLAFSQWIASPPPKRKQAFILPAMPLYIPSGFISAGDTFGNSYLPPIVPAEYSGALPGLSGPSADRFQLDLTQLPSIEPVPAPLVEPERLPATPTPISEGSTNPFTLPSDLPNELPEEGEESLEELIAYILELETPPPAEANALEQSASSMANSAPTATQFPVIKLSNGKYALETVQSVARQFLAGKSVSEVNKVTGIPTSPLRMWQKKLKEGVPPEELNLGDREVKPRSAETIQQACALLQQGERLYRVSRLYDNISLVTLHGWKKRLNQGETPEQIGRRHFKVRKQYSPETVQQAHDLFKRGHNIPAVSDRLKVPTATLHGWKQKWDKGETSEQICEKRFQKYSPETVQQAHDLCMRGYNIPAISDMLTVPTATLQGWQKKWDKGETPEQISKRFQDYSPETVQQAQDLLKRGHNIPAISDMLKIPIATLRGWKKKWEMRESGA